MKLLSKAKDGGPESNVTGYWFMEIKRLFSVVLLKFSHGSRDTYHSHAFNSVNWVLRGKVVEHHLGGGVTVHKPSFWPVITRRRTFHKVVSEGTTWVFSLRGPWSKTWMEWDGEEYTMLTEGRKVV